MTFKRFYRYDFASTQVLSDMRDAYFGITVSAQIVAYSQASVISILSMTQKPFFIDPMTFTFARSIENISRDGTLRKSFDKLARDYGSPFTVCLQGTRIVPDHFKSPSGELLDSAISQMCASVLRFQTEKVSGPSSFSKYEIILKRGVTPVPLSPSFLVAPYFYFRHCGDDWYKISLRAAQLSDAVKNGRTLYVVICLDRSLLTETEQLQRIQRDYSGFDGYIIWIDDFDDKEADDSELAGLRDFILGLSATGKPVFSLYGGYLFDLLSKFGLEGYSSGICYGSSRRVDTRGGGAGNRYYIPAAHEKVSDDIANAFFARSPRNRSLMCSCPVCSEIRSRLPDSLPPKDYADQFIFAMRFLDYRRHFVSVKKKEADELADLTTPQVMEALNADISRLSDADELPEPPTELQTFHLKRWRRLFETPVRQA